MHDPAGVDFTLRFVDRVARPADDRVAARELARLAGAGAALPAFVAGTDRLLLRAGGRLATALPHVVVPAARSRLRSLVGHLIVDAGGRGLDRRLAAARRDGHRLNLNLLGEAVLGRDEADRRLARTIALVRRPGVDHVSVKASSVVAQLVPWDLGGSRDLLVDRLLPLYRAAREHSVFVNLDMEEYKDLHLTIALFTTLLARPEFHDLPAGIVLQAYLPDSVAALDELGEFATRRAAAGGAPIKVRLVKGANLAMERVDAELHDWPQAPYATKAEVDANYVRLLDRGIGGPHADGMRLGIASHHLHHVALALELAEARGARPQLDLEMLQGMAPAFADAVAGDLPESGPGSQLVLYTPVVHRGDFDTAVSYLVRRLEENASPEGTCTHCSPPTPAARRATRSGSSPRYATATPSPPPRAAPRTAPCPRRSVPTARCRGTPCRPGSAPSPTPTRRCPRTASGPAAPRRPSSRARRSRSSPTRPRSTPRSSVPAPAAGARSPPRSGPRRCAAPPAHWPPPAGRCCR